MHLSRSLVLAATLVAVTSSTASAQLGGLGRRASSAIERKVNQKIDQKIEETAEKLVNQSFNSVFGEEGGSGSDKGGGTPRIFNVLPDAPTESHYTFDAVLTYELESTKKNGRTENSADVRMHFSRKGEYMATQIQPPKDSKEEADVFVIFDVKNEAMVMLMSSKDGKFSIAYGWKDALRYANSSNDDQQNAAANDELSKASFTSIGTRKIAGYEAEGYRTESNDGTVDVWVSKDAAIAFGRMMGATTSMKQLRSIPTNHPAGMMLEMVATDKSGDKSRMTATKIDVNANVRLDMSDYPNVGKAAQKK